MRARSGSDSCVISVDFSSITRDLTNMSGKLYPAVMLIATDGSRRMETYAKTNARWTDRTGNARQTLTGFAREKQGVIEAGVSHGVDYGIWLELAREGKYAILEESVLSETSSVLSALGEVMDHITR